MKINGADVLLCLQLIILSEQKKLITMDYRLHAAAGKEESGAEKRSMSSCSLDLQKLKFTRN